MRGFVGKTVLVTGGARGMGAEHARRLVADGAHVVLTDLLEDEGLALAADLGETALFQHHDVADEDGWRAVIIEARRFGGGLDGLVNNAGVARMGPIKDTTAEDFALHQRVNELGVFFGMKHVAPEIAARGGGAIVNVSSLGGLRAGGGDIAYVSSKWAVRGMTKSAAKELGPLGVRVNSIHPGMVRTEMLAAVPETLTQQRLSRIPLGREGTTQDMSNLVLFLLSDDASYITGAEIVIDGGLGL